MCPDKNQARSGGLEKYPRSRFCDHNQYCASSPYNEKLVKKDALRSVLGKRTGFQKNTNQQEKN